MRSPIPSSCPCCGRPTGPALGLIGETLITLRGALTVCDGTRHLKALYRWASRGVNGTYLETLMVGGTQCTTVEALQRFHDRLEYGAGLPPPRRRRSARKKVTKEWLREAGFDKEVDR